MKKLRDHAAGIDIGAKEIYVAIESGEVRSFETFTSDFQQAVDYLLFHKVQTIAMEATGVYWVILYEMLEKAGLDVWLVDGRQTRQVPGRKTDVKDSAWIQQLHSHGLLNRCFVPDDQVKEIRTYQRMREDHIRTAAMHVNHMQKALTLMNIRLKEAISQIQGASGMAIIRAILNGERDANVLLSLCHSTIIKNKSDKVLKALEGHYTSAGIFALKQACEGYDFYQNQIEECDKELEKVMNQISSKIEKKEKLNHSKKKRKPIRHNKPKIDDLGAHLIAIFGGRDATFLPGITDYNWLQLYSELGNDLNKWPTEKHFTSWLGLAPGQHRSGKMNRTRNKKGRPKAGQIFRQTSVSLIESKKIALGAFGRKLKARQGPGTAVKATARKLAVLYWRLMVKGLDYTEKGIKAYEEKVALQKERWLMKTLKEMGLKATLE